MTTVSDRLDHEVDRLWYLDAACRGPNQQIFYPPSQLERRSDKRAREERAKQICAECRVLDQCRSHALTLGEQHGIWGGMTEKERRTLT